MLFVSHQCCLNGEFRLLVILTSFLALFDLILFVVTTMFRPILQSSSNSCTSEIDELYISKEGCCIGRSKCDNKINSKIAVWTFLEIIIVYVSIRKVNSDSGWDFSFVIETLFIKYFLSLWQRSQKCKVLGIQWEKRKNFMSSGFILFFD